MYTCTQNRIRNVTYTQRECTNILYCTLQHEKKSSRKASPNPSHAFSWEVNDGKRPRNASLYVTMQSPCLKLNFVESAISPFVHSSSEPPNRVRIHGRRGKIDNTWWQGQIFLRAVTVDSSNVHWISCERKSTKSCL